MICFNSPSIQVAEESLLIECPTEYYYPSGHLHDETVQYGFVSCNFDQAVLVEYRYVPFRTISWRRLDFVISVQFDDYQVSECIGSVYIDSLSTDSIYMIMYKEGIVVGRFKKN